MFEVTSEFFSMLISRCLTDVVSDLGKNEWKGLISFLANF